MAQCVLRSLRDARCSDDDAVIVAHQVIPISTVLAGGLQLTGKCPIHFIRFKGCHVLFSLPVYFTQSLVEYAKRQVEYRSEDSGVDGEGVYLASLLERR